MAGRYALLVGLSMVHSVAYNGWDGRNGCWEAEADVDRMCKLLRWRSFQVQTLKTRSATHDAVLGYLDEAAHSLRAGDLFVFYYSSHGSARLDLKPAESNAANETLSAWDGQILHDELFDTLARFEAGVRIVSISDACNSTCTNRQPEGQMGQFPVLIMPPSSLGIKASLLCFNITQDKSQAQGDHDGGYFSKRLMQLWGKSGFNGTYADLAEALRQGLAGWQALNCAVFGRGGEEMWGAGVFGGGDFGEGIIL